MILETLQLATPPMEGCIFGQIQHEHSYTEAIRGNRPERRQHRDSFLLATSMLQQLTYGNIRNTAMKLAGLPKPLEQEESSRFQNLPVI